MARIGNNKIVVKPKGYIDKAKGVFVIQNYDECREAGLIGYLETKTPQQLDFEEKNWKEMFQKYKPEFMKEKKSYPLDKQIKKE